MPVSVKKVDGKYRVSTPNQTHAFGTTRRKAERQARLLRAIDHGWHPTQKQESVREEAQVLVDALLEVDEIGSVPIPASGKAYARMRGMGALRGKEQLRMRMCRDLGDAGKPLKGFKNYDGSAFTGRKKQEHMDSAPVSRALERHHTEKTRFSGGKYGKGVTSKGKTSGKFQMPGQWAVSSAIKS